MLEKEWAKFLSGSDIRGTASEGVSGQPVDLTDPVVERMVKGFCVWLKRRTGKQCVRVTLGHDSRISAPRLRACAERSFLSQGVEVLSMGLASTPSLFLSTVREETRADGALMLTASHHPFNKNGLKFFVREGGLESGDIREILELAQTGDFEQISGGTVEKCGFMHTYASILREKFLAACGQERPLEGLHIVVDAGNGAGGFFVEEVLKPLGANTDGSQFLEPDGSFPNHIPNPENPAAMQAIRDAVLKSRADFGVIFDTDVDRAGAVFSNGEEVNRNRLIALISAILLEENPGATIVTDSVTSDGLAAFLRAHGGVHRRYKRGYKNVINEAIRLNREGVDCPLAIETSGHAALRENYFLDDGAYLMVRILIQLALLKRQGRSLEDFLADLPVPAEECEVRLGFTVPDFRECGNRVLDAISAHCAEDPSWSLAPDSCEGVRVSFREGEGDGFFLLRMSVHDPIMPLNIESNVPGGCKQIAYKLNAFLAQFEGLDRKNLQNYLK